MFFISSYKWHWLLHVDIASCNLAELIYYYYSEVLGWGGGLALISNVILRPSSHVQRRFYLFFAVWMPFISSPCLMIEALTSSTILILRKYPVLYCKLWCDLKISVIAHHWVNIPSIPSLQRVFTANGYWILSEAFRVPVEMIICFSSVVCAPWVWMMLIYFLTSSQAEFPG